MIILELLLTFSLFGWLAFVNYRQGNTKRASKIAFGMVGLVVFLLIYISICSLG